MFKKASDYKNEKLSIVVFGEPNAGKTRLTLTIKEPQIIIDAEKGLQSINERDDIPVFPLWCDSKGEEVPRHKRFPRLVSFFNKLKRGEIEEAKGTKWLVIDSITEISQNLVEQVKLEYETEVKNGMKPNKFWPWDQYNERITHFLKDLRDIKDVNILLLALVDETNSSDGEGKDKKLDMQGKISKRLPAIFDEVFFLERTADGKKSFLITDNYKNIICKDRSGALKQFEEPNIDVIAKKIKSGKKRVMTSEEAVDKAKETKKQIVGEKSSEASPN